MNFGDATILITGGTGSLGQALTERLLKEPELPEKIVIFSRDEAKQHAMRLKFQNLSVATDEVIYNNFKERVQFIIGDIRDFRAVRQAIRGIDIVFHAAAIKQVPTAEYFPDEAFKTNVIGAENLVSAIAESEYDVPEMVIGVSTDKACHPSCAYGMTKALMERIFISANIRCDDTAFIMTRYGNVMGSTGSVLPLFADQIRNGKPLTVTSADMTRYMMNIDAAIDTIFYACDKGDYGQIIVPVIPSARIIEVAELMAEGTNSEIKIIGIRPGEKMHEVLVSEEEMPYTTLEGNYFTVRSMLPELTCEHEPGGFHPNTEVHPEYSSKWNPVPKPMLKALLAEEGYMT